MLLDSMSWLDNPHQDDKFNNHKTKKIRFVYYSLTEEVPGTSGDNSKTKQQKT